MDRQKILLAIGISFLLVLSACGEKKTCPISCDDSNPCTADSCGKETNFDCKNAPIAGCSKECGVPCTGAAGRFMSMQCDTATKKCAADVSATTKAVIVPLTLEQSVLGLKIRAELAMSQPFNLKKDVIQVKASAPILPAGTTYAKIKKIEITGLNSAKQTVIIASKQVEKTIWGTSGSIMEELKATFPASGNDGTFTALYIIIGFEYDKKLATGTQVTPGESKIAMGTQKFEWLNPTMTLKCPASCDDANSATEDICDASTGYFCEHRAVTGMCGNYVCDSSEDKCTCAADCGQCLGDASLHLSYQCSEENRCVTVLKPGLVQEPISLFDDRNINYFHLQNTYSYNNPLNVKKDKFKLEFKLFSISPQYQDVKITTVRLMERDKAIASAEVNRGFSMAGDMFTAEMPIASFVGTEEDKTLSLTVWYEYSQISGNTTIPKNGNYVKALSKITFVNPTG